MIFTRNGRQIYQNGVAQSVEQRGTITRRSAVRFRPPFQVKCNYMIPKFIKAAIIKAIKKRVLKRTQQFGDYENATSFIINAPIKEWRSRLWLVENVGDGTDFCCTDEKLYQWLIRH